MELSTTQGNLQGQVKRTVQRVTHHLVRQLLTIPAVVSVQLAGQLDMIVNNNVLVSFIPPSVCHSQCVSGAGRQRAGMVPVVESSDCGASVGHRPVRSGVEEGGRCGQSRFEFCCSEADGGQMGVGGAMTSQGGVSGGSQTRSPASLPNEEDLKKAGHTSCDETPAVTCAETADYLNHSIHGLTAVKAEMSHCLESQDLSDSKEELAVKSVDNLERCHIIAALESKLSCPVIERREEDSVGNRKSPEKIVSLGEKEQHTKMAIECEASLTQQKSTLDDKNGSLTAGVTQKRKLATNWESSKTETELQCTVCQKLYPPGKRNAFRKHVKRHTQNTQCETCGKWLSSADSLKDHQRGVHSQEKPYQCKQCGESFSFFHSFKMHSYKHSGRRPYVCPQCSKSYLTSSHLKAHLVSAHTKKSGQDRFQCEECGRTFGSAASLKNHGFRHTGVKPFHCDVCSKGFSSKSALQLHSKSVHVTVRKFDCDICHKLYKSQHIRNIHRRRHSIQETGQFICDVCGQQFMFQSGLKAHAAIHQAGCPYVCKVCSKGFKLLSSLYSHRYTHTTERPHQCSVCPKVFKTKSACAAHERRHRASSDFVCQRCSARFPDKGGLDKHTRSVHKLSAMLQCLLCGKVGARRDNMRTHVKSHGRDKTFEQLNACIRQLSD